MVSKQIEVLSWVLIYGGLVGLILGWFLAPLQGPWGELLMTGGAIATVTGVVLIVVRSRMKA
jgi:F0F1-type ATP synthase assembly protein I